jgi:spermidine synthase
MAHAPHRWLPLATVTVISIITIALQLVHTRILSFMFWSHVVYLFVYLALLGYGTAGAIGASMSRERLERPSTTYFNLAAFAVANVASVWLVGRLSARDPQAFTLGAEHQNVWALVGSYALFAVPYFFLGLALISTFARHREAFDTLYAVDLAAAALGAITFVLLLGPLGAPRMVFALSLLAGALALVGFALSAPSPVRRRSAVLAGLPALAVCGWATVEADAILDLRPLPSKLMGTARDPRLNPAFRLWHTSWNPVGRLDVFRVESEAMLDMGTVKLPPHAFSLTYDGDAFTAFPEIPSTWPTEEDRRLFHDAPGQSAALPETRFLWHAESPNAADGRYSDRYMAATPYLWHPGAEVLVIGTGGGGDVRVALLEGASKIDGVEINRATIDAMTGPFAERSGRIFLRPNVRMFAGDGRSFLMHTKDRWDIIHMTGIDTFLAASNGSFVMTENYLYTVEAVKSYFEHLTPRGVYTCVRWEFEVPRETFRVFANTLQALSELGIKDPARHVIVTTFPPGRVQALLMMQRSPFTADQIEVVRQRAEDSGGGIIFAPGRAPTWTVGGFYTDLAASYRSGRPAAFFAAYPFDVSPVRDDRPFFYQYYRFSTLWQAWRQGAVARGTAQHGYWPFVILVAVFVQAIVLIALFIFLPLAVWRGSGLRVQGAPSFAAYFAALGMGYIMIELALMQKFSLLLGDPIYSIMIVLASMLLFTGVGSFLSGRVRLDTRAALMRALLAVLVTLFAMVVGLEPLVYHVLGAPLAVRALIAVLCCAAVCIGLGFFFPLGVRMVDKVSPAFLPWAWGINGGFSVLGSVGTVALALWGGFNTVLAVAAVVYAIGVLTLIRFSGRGAEPAPA